MNDPFIDQLVNDLQPKRPLRDTDLWALGIIGFIFAAIAIAGTIGLRPDFFQAAKTGALFWKPGIFFIAWLASSLLIMSLSRPHGKIKKWHLSLFILALFTLLYQLLIQSQFVGSKEVGQVLRDKSAIYCLSIITGGGGLLLFAAWKLWITNAASMQPKLLGLLAGLNAGSIMAAIYAMHCDIDVALYVLVYYGLSIAMLSAVGAYFGQKLLRW